MADARVGRAGEVDRDDLRAGHVIGAADELLGELPAALAHGHRAERAVPRVAVRPQDHAAAARHLFAVIAVDDGQVGGHIDAAVLLRRGKREFVVVLVDRAADGAQAVVAIGEHIGHREGGHAARTGGLDDAHIGDVVRGQAVKAQAQVRHVAALVVRRQNAIGHRALARRRFVRGLSRPGGVFRLAHEFAPGQQECAGIKQFHSSLLTLMIQTFLLSFYHERRAK